MNKCILVGNASNILGKKLGSYIDKRGIESRQLNTFLHVP